MKQFAAITLISLSAIFMAWLLQASIHSYINTQNGKQLINRIGTPYQKHNNGKRTDKIFIYGDSAAFGTGASTPEKSFAGIVGENCENCSVTNFGQNGFKTEDLLEQLKRASPTQVDKTFLLIGSNDIMHFYVDLDKSCSNLETILQNSSEQSSKTYLLTTPNASYAGFFLFPLNHYYGIRSRQFNKCANHAAAKIENTYYINLESNYSKHLFKQHQSSDMLHMNDKGNLYWYQLIQELTK